MTSELQDIVTSIVRELNASLAKAVPLEQGEDAPLFGGEGSLDSLALVQLVVAVEEEIEDRFGVAVTLADERAVSQTVSPFRTVGTLVSYASRVLADARCIQR